MCQARILHPHFRKGLYVALVPLLIASFGCTQAHIERRAALARRILPEESDTIPSRSQEGREASAKSVVADAMVRPAAASQPEVKETNDLPPALGPTGASELRTPKPPEPSVPASRDETAIDSVPGKPIDLPEAIGLAFRYQPRLRVYLETIEQARGLEGVAFSPFLPTLGGGYSVGGFDLSVGGEPVRVGRLPGFAVLPPGFALPVGLHVSTGYELAELKLQWLICDFGRRLGLYQAAKLGVDIAQLQTDRAFQTVANEVSVAYYNVLRAQALRRTALEAVRRAEDELDVARKLAGGGVVEREKVLRAEVQLAESQRLLDTSEEAVGVAAAALNLAIGLRCGEPIAVVEPASIPTFAPSLVECLQTAVDRRREFQVAQRSVDVAQEGVRAARASFAPRIVSEGLLFDLQQSSPRAFADSALGFIKLEWKFFEGGRRIAERRGADSKVREAMAAAESIADTIAFQVNENYRHLTAARLGIERARPAVEQAKENYRLVRARAREGEATPAEITDAETALTRAEQNYLNSIYDYLSAISKLEYSMGITPTPTTVANRHP